MEHLTESMEHQNEPMEHQNESEEDQNEPMEAQDESDVSDDGVVAGEDVLYVGEYESDQEDNKTNPERRKKFKRERKQRLKEIAELETKLKERRRESHERKRQRRHVRRQKVERELFEADKETIEKRMDDCTEKFFDRAEEEREFAGRRLRKGSDTYMDEDEPVSYKGISDKQRLIEMIMEISDSDSETSDDSEQENIEVEIYRKKLLNTKCQDLMELDQTKISFSKKILLGDSYFVNRYFEMCPDLTKEIHFLTIMVYLAVNSNTTSCLKILFRQGARSSRPSRYEVDKSKTPLHLACERNYKDCAATLIRFKAKTEKRDDIGNTPLMTAMHFGACKEIVEVVLSRPKLKLSEHINYEGVGLLAHHGPWYESDRKTLRTNEEALDFLLARAKEEGELEALLNHRCPRTTNPPLIDAVAANNEKNVKLLVDYGADVNAIPNSVYSQKRTALHMAAKHLSPTMMQYLLEAGAAPDAVDSDGVNILQYIFRYYSTINMYQGFQQELNPCLALLAKHGADINAVVNDRGDTAMHLAVNLALVVGSNDVVLSLVKCGGNVFVRNIAGVTPLDLARRAKNNQLFGLIEEIISRMKSLSEYCKWTIHTSMGRSGPIGHTAKLLPLPKRVIEFIMERDT